METNWVHEATPERESWMTPIRNYLERGTLPERRSEKRQVLWKISRFVIQDGILYIRGFSVPLLRCIAHDEIKRMLHEVHEEECGDHTGGQALVKKIFRYGYYRPTVNRDASMLRVVISAKNMPEFREHSNGRSIVVCHMEYWHNKVLPLAKGDAKYAIVAVDYFTKWAKAEPLATITTKKIINFIVRNIVCLFGLPRAIATDSGA